MPVIVIDDSVHKIKDFDVPESLREHLWNMEDNHFWHRARNEWILKCLRANDVKTSASILEVGCGSGAVTRRLHNEGYHVTGVDTCLPLAQKAAERCPVNIYCGPLNALPEHLHGSFDVIGFFDVLEHLDDPGELLITARDFLRPDGKVIITVPALQSLFSQIDEFSGHKKRYERGEISEMLEACEYVPIVEYGIFRLTLIAQKFQQYVSIHNSPKGSKQLGRNIYEKTERKMEILKKYIAIPMQPLNWIFMSLCKFERNFAWQSARSQTGASLMILGRRN